MRTLSRTAATGQGEERDILLYVFFLFAEDEIIRGEVGVDERPTRRHTNPEDDKRDQRTIRNPTQPAAAH
jgi:hypothetical protein